jgi:hypothetical protein
LHSSLTTGGEQLIIIMLMINNNNTRQATIIIIIIIIIMKSAIGRDKHYCHNVILRSAGFAITLNYHPARCVVVIKVVYHPPYGWLVFLGVEVGLR